jgi:glutaredoxin 3
MAEHTIDIYTTTTCPYCIQTKKFLDEKGVTYTNHDVAADPEAKKEMIEKSSQMGVPVLIIDGNIVVGFDRQEIEAALGL